MQCLQYNNIKIISFNLFSEEFDETTIENILKSVVALLEIDEPESKAKVLMLIAEIAKSGTVTEV